MLPRALAPRHAFFAAMIVIACASMAAQTVPAAKGARATTTNTTHAIPRTPDGRPDLSGIWDYATITPLERPAAFAGKTELTPEEDRKSVV